MVLLGEGQGGVIGGVELMGDGWEGWEATDAKAAMAEV